MNWSYSSSIIGSCASLNITGCCDNGTCYTGTGCYCDQLCYQYNDCCPDIASIGCLPNFISSSFATSSILTASPTPTVTSTVTPTGNYRLNLSMLLNCRFMCIPKHHWLLC